MTPSNPMPSSWTFDFVSGYKHKPIPLGSNMSLEELRKGGYVLDEKQWLTVCLSTFLLVWSNYFPLLKRILFLESIAGVPGMVAATLRHLKSLRLMVCSNLLSLSPTCIR
jgi:ubiquinol oxidase